MKKCYLRFGLLMMATVTMADSCDPPTPQGSFSLEKDIDGVVYPNEGVQLELFNFRCPDCGGRRSYQTYRDEMQAQMQTFIATHRTVKVNTYRDASSGNLEAAEVYYIPKEEK